MQIKTLFLGATSFGLALGLPFFDTLSSSPTDDGKVQDIQDRGVSAAPVNGPGFKSGITYSHYVSLTLVVDSSHR